MHCAPGWPLAAPLILAAGAATPGTDRLMLLSEDYHSREGKAGGTWDWCVRPEIHPAEPARTDDRAAWPPDGRPSGPACQRYNACCHLQEYSQAWCEERMRSEMMGICNTPRPAGSPPAVSYRSRLPARPLPNWTSSSPPGMRYAQKLVMPLVRRHLKPA